MVRRSRRRSRCDASVSDEEELRLLLQGPQSPRQAIPFAPRWHNSLFEALTQTACGPTDKNEGDGHLKDCKHDDVEAGGGVRSRCLKMDVVVL